MLGHNTSSGGSLYLGNVLASIRLQVRPNPILLNELMFKGRRTFKHLDELIVRRYEYYDFLPFADGNIRM